MLSVMGLLEKIFTINSFTGDLFKKTKSTSGAGSIDAAFAKFESLAGEYYPGGVEALRQEGLWNEVKGIKNKKELTQWGHNKISGVSKKKIDSFMDDLKSFKPQ